MDKLPPIWAWITHPLYLYQSAHLSVLFIFLTFVHLCVCFILLGVCASDYLCPIVVRLTNQRTKPQKGIFAALLLAWCNSSPDLFSNLMSWNSANNAAALSIGEVLGACGVIICVVQGAIFMVMQTAWFNLQAYERHAIVVDLLFTLVSVSIIVYVCVTNEVTVMNCIVMVLVYITYVILKVFIWTPPIPSIEVSSPVTTEAPTVPDGMGAFSGLEEVGSQYFISDIDTGIKPSLLTSMDYTHFLKAFESTHESENTDSISMETIGTSPLNNRPVTEPRGRNDMFSTTDSTHTAPAMFQLYSGGSECYHTIERTRSADLTKWRFDQLHASILYMIAPQLMNFTEKSRLSQLISIVLTPFMILLRVTIPQYETFIEQTSEASDLYLPKRIIALSMVHAMLAPLWAVLLFLSLTEIRAPTALWPLVGCVSCLLLLGIFMLRRYVSAANKFSLTDSMPMSMERAEGFSRTMSLIFNVIGICCSILWISYLANTLIEIMILYQRITHVSEAILGLTIFSWGNSISDLMSNVAMAKLYHKFPADEGAHLDTKFLTISLGACLGGVLLNTMIGIGISGLFAMVPARKWSIILREEGVDTKFLVSGVAILLQIIFLIWLFTANLRFLHFHLRAVGFAMCAWWLSATLLNLILEISV
ncbi:HHL303Cp [Eremothecium sinecaudum]|uniref:HHL303Cp n=1 Tax=Eremothecium sinecaudum TaxID=45286 RepID=A0A0X8HVY3_9SACH|nr:HHL303Cp [Eremothecium sinecaudum]AMD22467.1 HHL303Cp [Eremothecium sinecaudum]